ncbi:MAG: hypothetical protein AAGG38_02800 [Planctomycetota bacterium]
MPIHVAVLQREYLRMILAGQKTVESRLAKVRCPPFGAVTAGERLFFKASGGSFMATALADEVHDHAHQTPTQLDALRTRWNPAVCGTDEYWNQRRDRPFATFIRLRGVEPLDCGPRYKTQNMRAWYTLTDTANPLLDIKLRRGAYKNRYVQLPQASEAMRAAAFSLELPDGNIVETDLVPGSTRVRWRGWKRYFDAFGLRPGDTIRFVALGDRRYRVLFRRTA